MNGRSHPRRHSKPHALCALPDLRLHGHCTSSNRLTHARVYCAPPDLQRRAQKLQICPFIFNNFHDAPPANPFLSSFCTVAGGGHTPYISQIGTVCYSASVSASTSGTSSRVRERSSRRMMSAEKP